MCHRVSRENSLSRSKYPFEILSAKPIFPVAEAQRYGFTAPCTFSKRACCTSVAEACGCRRLSQPLSHTLPLQCNDATRLETGTFFIQIFLSLTFLISCDSRIWKIPKRFQVKVVGSASKRPFSEASQNKSPCFYEPTMSRISHPHVFSVFICVNLSVNGYFDL